ncbi:histidine phosphatase family protein [Clostridium algidicarnis]|uniref:histidine phosphatase family protein n=1 Tax=Clostridium algidicarnis TaxID=37659 RepID=UPI001C0D34A8|nr:histidine phosphatase family protein [Clostridium algidicarnis]MBU3206618.1 histidine phosphatase family protein [Clostridium algidicarnis]
MKIGLVRHFKVNIEHKKYMNSTEYNEYANRYNISEVFEKKVDLGNVTWNKCYCSNLSRAIFTAKSIYKGDIIVTESLREIQTLSRFNTRLPLHYYLWDVIGRVSWIRNHPSQPEIRSLTKVRVKNILDEIIANATEEDNILIVSHAGIMYSIRKELERRGFKGDKFLKAENGKLYLYEK